MSSHRAPAVNLLPALLAGGVCTSIACSQALPTFTKSEQELGDSSSQSIALGDLDGDGDLDLWVANSTGFNGEPNTVWFNEGNGIFSNSGQALGNQFSRAVALGDLDGDGDLDALVGNCGWSEPDTVWINDGTGSFTNSEQAWGESCTNAVALGDLDGDGDLDAVFSRFTANTNNVWLNDGTASFQDSGQALGDTSSRSIALDDLDGDGDLDAVFANDGFDQPNTVWTNDGTGTFTDSGQALGNSRSYSVALGDLDGDGDLDAVFGNGWSSNSVWMNNGTGAFSQSQAFGAVEGDCIIRNRRVFLGDMDLDGDLDAIAVTESTRGAPNTLWINNGTGFEQAPWNFGEARTITAALGDLDQDGDPDVVFGNAYGGQIMCAPTYRAPNTVWFTQPPGACCLDENCTPISGAGIDLCLGLGGTYIDADCLVANCGASESTGSCCVASGCELLPETACTNLGGSWTEGGSCDDCPTTCPADLNGDGVVDGFDLAMVLGAWGLPCDS